MRYARLDGGSRLEVRRIEWTELASRGGELVAAGPLEAVIAGSVRDDLLPAVSRLLPAGGPPLRLARRDFALPIRVLYKDPTEVGTDRLLNALAVRERARGGGAVAVDFGTAIAISVVSPQGEFAGGLIAAGSRVLREGLRLVTPRLPPLDLVPVEGFIQQDALSALRAGTSLQIASGVSAMLQGIRRTVAWPRLRVFATGGEAERWAPLVREIDEVVPQLTMEGLALAWRLSAAGEAR